MKKEKLKHIPLSRAASLVGRLSESQEKRNVYCASDITKNWRYIDFYNPLQNLPCISLEYLFGCRGLLAGRLIRLQAAYGVGKSSFMWLMYAAAQKLANAFCYHLESESTPPPPDFISSFGCDPSDLAIECPGSLERSLEKMDEVMAQIRGGVAEKVKDPETGKMRKTKFTNPLDKDFGSPIIIGMDSFSGLPLAVRAEQDILDQDKTAKIAAHSLKMSNYLQERSERFNDCQALLMIAAQEKTAIKLGPAAFGGGGSGKTSLGDKPIGFYSTYCVDMTGHKYIDKAVGLDIGERITMITTKNKLSPKHRMLNMYLIRDHGFDLIKTDADFLLKHSASPLKGVASKTGQWIKCPPLQEKAFTSDLDFVQAFYANTELVEACREALRIRGFGYDFETKYMLSESEIEDNSATLKGEEHGVESSTGSVPPAEDVS